LLGCQPRSKLPRAVNEPVLVGVTSGNDILADTVEDFGPCCSNKGETNAPVRLSGATLSSLSPLASGAGDISNKSWTLDRSGVGARSLVRRTYNRTATGVLRRNASLSSLPAVDGPAIGAQNRVLGWRPESHSNRTGVAASYQAGAFPLTGPDDVGELSSKFHPRRWRCLMKTLMNRKYYPKGSLWYICITKVCIQPLLSGRCPPG
jgi:hypothetical protein